MSITNRFTTITNGSMVLIGNTLNITRVGPNTRATGAFTTTDTTLQVPGYPSGTTLDWTQNSSSSSLSILPNSTILYAQLMWIESYPLPQTEDTYITFKTPTQTLQILPTAFEDITLQGSATKNYYWRAADVTPYITSGGNGVYTVGHVPSTLDYFNDGTRCGWALIISYHNQSLPARYLNIQSGYRLTSASNPLITTLNNFKTPSLGASHGYLLYAGSGGKPTSNIIMNAGTTPLGNPLLSPSTYNQTSPYNPQNNLFQSVINQANPESMSVGLLNETGTFGTNNNNPFEQTIPSFSRNMLDLTALDLSSALTPNQNALTITTSSLTSGQVETMLQAVMIDVNAPNFATLSKTVDKTYTQLFDTLTYTIVIKNTGLVSAIDLTLIDEPPIGTYFVEGSVYINAVNDVLANPSGSGIYLGTLDPTEEIIITYQVTVASMPQNLEVNNVGTFTYSYDVDPNLPLVLAQIKTPVAKSYMNFGNISTTGNFLTSVDLSIADIGNILSYTTVVINTGNVAVENVVITNPLPSGLTFQQGTLFINGSQSNDNIITGVSIPTIGVGETKTLTYKVKITALPPTPTVDSIAYVTYQYLIDPTTLLYASVSGVSNIATTTVLHPNFGSVNGLTFSCNKSFASVLDSVTYSLTLMNSGSTSANNLLISNLIPSHTSYVENSMQINNSPALFNPNEPLKIASIPVNETKVITYDVLVLSIPSSNELASVANLTYDYTVYAPLPNASHDTFTSNTVSVQIRYADLLSMGSFIKTVGTPQCQICDVLSYSIIAINTGNTDAYQIEITDIIPMSGKFVAGSYKFNGMTIPTTPDIGILIPLIPVGGSALIEFQIQIIGHPLQNPMGNIASIHYLYTVDPSLPNGDSRTGYSNTANTIVLPNQL